jgi:uncharacterized protein
VGDYVMFKLTGVWLSTVFLAICSMHANARDLRSCLAITDTDSKIECLEGREDPQPNAMVQPQARPRFSTSFNCAKAVSSIEVTICSDSELAQLDSQMGQLYSEALKGRNNNRTMISEQLQWISLRKSKCEQGSLSKIRACIMQLTRDRIASLTAIATAQNTKPIKQNDNKKIPVPNADLTHHLDDDAGGDPFAQPQGRSIPLQHEPAEELPELGMPIKWQDMRDELVRPHDDQAPVPPVDPTDIEDVVPVFEVRAKHLFVVAQSKTSFSRNEQRRHRANIEFVMALLKDRPDIDHRIDVLTRRRVLANR